MDKLLLSKIALVTGGARGIGRAIALELAAEGADVAIVDLKIESEAQNVVAEIQKLGRHALAIQADVTDFSRAQQVVDDVMSGLGGLDILVNNAGIHQNCPIWEMDVEQWNNVLDVNLKLMVRSFSRLVSRNYWPIGYRYLSGSPARIRFSPEHLKAA